MPTSTRLTWVFDSRYGEATIDGRVFKDRRVMVNSAGGARLYARTSTSPLRKLEGSSYRTEQGHWIIEGENENGEREVWSVPVVQAKRPCGSCGGGR